MKRIFNYLNFSVLKKIGIPAVTIVVFGLIFSCVASKDSGKNTIDKKWVGTWSTAPQLVEPRNVPPEPGLTGNTLRQIVAVSIGGDELRMKFSNDFSDSPVEMKNVQISVSTGNGTIDAATAKELKFNNSGSVTIPAGEAIYSDSIKFDLEPRMRLAITIAFGETAENITGHPGSRTTSYLMEGQHTDANADFSSAVKTDHWYVINTIEVKAEKPAAAVAIIGNSITDGRGSGTNKQNRWPDILSQELLKNPETENIGVLNMGIGGNAVLRGGLGPTALDRFERDILQQNGVRWVIIMEGVNDLGGTPDSTAAFKVADGLISAYQQMINKAHEKGLKVYGGTITPIDKSFYYQDYREAARQKVNKWIRNSGAFDAVIDFDQTVRNPENPSVILENAHDGDHLHPNEYGYELMGKAVDLSLFSKN